MVSSFWPSAPPCKSRTVSATRALWELIIRIACSRARMSQKWTCEPSEYWRAGGMSHSELRVCTAGPFGGALASGSCFPASPQRARVHCLPLPRAVFGPSLRPTCRCPSRPSGHHHGSSLLFGAPRLPSIAHTMSPKRFQAACDRLTHGLGYVATDRHGIHGPGISTRMSLTHACLAGSRAP